MIDEKRLKYLTQASEQGFCIAPPEMLEILRLAQIGMWVKEHAVPAL